MPGKEDEEDIKYGEPYQEEWISEGETIELVYDEETEYGNTRRIRPQLIAEQTNDQECLDDAVREEIHGPECL